ncbi:MAG: ABC transporter substrate-binding protein [Streptosporangiaceae bacterium]
MRSRYPKGLAVFAAAALLAAGCGVPGGSSSSTSSRSGAVTVKLALPHKGLLTTSLPYAVAKARGFFKDQGINVQPVYTSGGGSTVQTTIGGNTDIAVETGPSAVFSAYEHGAKLKIIGATMTGLDILFFVKESSPYHSLKDLSGKKVGYSEPGSSSNVAVDQVNARLKKMGRAPAKPEAVGSPPDQLTAVQTGQIAAGFTAAPLFFDKVAAGKLRIVAEPKDFPAYSDVAVRVAFTSADFAQQHAKAVRGFLAAWHKAWKWSFAHQKQATKIYKKAFDLDQDLASLRKSFDYYTPRMVRLAPVHGLDQAAKDALRFKLIEKPLSDKELSEILDTSYAPKGA